ncbi:MAG: amino acid ABC transporter permease [Rhodospirillaceae bacterium]|jgi:general L-amino acid transport system permease protein|nr:amino acid ABC transporter permease [Rhodospirillaceae bacterium]MBT5809575.1 amino acid ABC transporter permease [Rhodospirillaceae bacterium]
MAVTTETQAPTRSLWYDPKFRAILYQVLLLAAFLGFTAYIINNTVQNLQERGIASGFGFLTTQAGFDVGISPFIKYDPTTATHGTVLLVGIQNTLVVAILGCILATLIGFFVGVMRLSNNWLVAKLAYCYIEALRNIPLLLQLIFWWHVSINLLPQVRQTFNFNDAVLLNNRGLFLPAPVPEDGFGVVWAAMAIAIVATYVMIRWAHKRQDATGEPFPSILASLGVLIGLPLIVFLVSGRPMHFDYAIVTRFSLSGGLIIPPEFLALLMGLVLYTGAFIAEIVRSGIQAVSHGQTEAARALGVKPGVTMRLIILPQALRVIVPPLTSQYLNLTKNSSLSLAIGGSEIVAIFMGTSLNQAGQAIEIIAITMTFYLALSLAISIFMNWYNNRIALVER